MMKRGSTLIWIIIILIVIISIISLIVFLSKSSSTKDNLSLSERLTKQDFINRCNSKSGEEERNCFQGVAEVFGDKELCDKSRLIDRCKERIDLYAKENINGCEDYSPNKEGFALKSDQEECYGFAAVYLEDFNGCEKGYFPSIGDCKVRIASKIGILELCDKNSDNNNNNNIKTTCYAHVAINRDNPKICDKLEQQSDISQCNELFKILS